MPELPVLGLDLNLKPPAVAVPVLAPAIKVMSLPAAFVCPIGKSTCILSGAALSVIIPDKVVLLSPI